MDASTASPYLSKLLDVSIALFILVVLVLALGYAVWKLWKDNRAQAEAHAVEKQQLNDKLLTESEVNSESRRQRNEQMRDVVDQLKNVLISLNADKNLSARDRKLVVAMYLKLGCDPAELQ